MAKSMPSTHELNHLFLDESACIHFLMENREERNSRSLVGIYMEKKEERFFMDRIYSCFKSTFMNKDEYLYLFYSVNKSSKWPYLSYFVVSLEG